MTDLLASILFITTSHRELGDTGKPTGVWLQELTTPYYIMKDAGCRVTICSIRGGSVPVAPGSEGSPGSRPGSVERFLNDADATAELHRSLPVHDARIEEYDAVFLPGGHGTMWDLPVDKSLARLLTEAERQQKVIAAVCHGPAGLIGVKRGDGFPLVAGKRISAFTDSEEKAVGLAGQVPFLLESRLRELGAVFESSEDFKPHAIRDGRLITGQNPASSELVAKHVVAALRERNR